MFCWPCSSTLIKAIIKHQPSNNNMMTQIQHLNIMSQSPVNQPNNTGIQKDWKVSVAISMTALSDSFSVGSSDVIFSRGKKAKSHAGNIFFQSIIEKSAEKYAKAEGRLGKSIIVSEIIDTVRQHSPNGGFVKKDRGKWFEVGDWSARERVGQSLRDLLHGQYRSSASSKKRRREEANTKMIDTLIGSNNYVSKRIRCLSDNIENQGSQVSDVYLMLMMTQANSEILDQLKQDNSVQQKLSEMGSVSSKEEDSKPKAK
jgi:hypothetical protein